jgi:hypothetical protein
MLVAHFQQSGQRRISREVAADARILLVLAMDHGHRIPTDERFQPLLELAVARVGHFIMLGNGIQVRGGKRHGGGDAGFARSLPEGGDQFGAVFGTFPNDQVVESLNPLRYFL